MSTASVAEIHYRIDTPARGHFPGHHRSRRGEGGFEFRGHADLIDAPDPRRLDLHASLRDPFGHWRVRVHSLRKAVPVVVLADLSASMDFEGEHRKAAVLADFVDSLGWSAWRNGDRFGFIGCDAEVRPEWQRWPTRARGAAGVLAQALRGWRPAGPSARSAEGLREAHRSFERQRALVFLVSDFHWPAGLLQDVLGSLATHEVVPVVLWDAREFALSAPRGLAQTVDPESGRRQLVWWRPALRERWQRAHAQRRAALDHAFAAHRVTPLFVEGGFDADAVTRHFFG